MRRPEQSEVQREPRALACPFLAEGSKFSRYVVCHCVGRGGMGAVYEARHAVLNKRVALKTLHGAQADQAQCERFLREAELAARVRHPHVVDIYDAGVEDGVPFLAMELLEGEDLAQRLARDGRLLARDAVDIVIPMIAGLAELHRVGIAHRDVKPDNIFLAYDPHGNVVVTLIDFGISKDFDAEGERSSGVEQVAPDCRRWRPFEGTPHYMAPELMRGEGALDPRTDQYALGVVLYQCLSGVVPYQGASLLDLAYRVCGGEYVALESLRSDLPTELLAVVARAMSCAIEDRFPSMEALGQALLPFASPELRAVHELTLSRGVRASLPPPRPSTPPTKALTPSSAAPSGLGDATTVSEQVLERMAVPRVRRAWLRSLLFTAALGGLLAGGYAWRSIATSAIQAEPELSAPILLGPVFSSSARLVF